MNYLVTGGTGFVGRHLVDRLVARGGTVHLLVLPSEEELFDELSVRWLDGPGHVGALAGDVTRPWLDLDDADLASISDVDHIFHLATLRDFEADPVRIRRVNVDGTRNVIETAERVRARRLHHVSTIGVAGRYPGRFAESMLREGRGLDNAYYRTKHRAERLLHSDCGVPWRVYRPGMVVGHSQSGETLRADGLYHLFPAVKRLAGLPLPQGLPLLGVDGGRVHVVPVDYVADAIDAIAHADGLDYQTFHLVDREPPTFGEALDAVSRAAGGPSFPVRIDARATRVIPGSVRTLFGALPPVHKTRNAVLHGLGIPKQPLALLLNSTRFETENTDKALADTGIRVPRLADYADALWAYWEDHFDRPIPGIRTERERFKGRTILVTGASAGIGLETARQLAERGSKLILVALYMHELEPVVAELRAGGADVSAYEANLMDLDAVEALVGQVIADHGGVDVLVNNAGMSIRRSVTYAYDRMHDYERTMQLNYFGAVRLTLGLLPGMRERRYGHVVNISSIAAQTNQPRFSAYVASKTALDAFSRTIGTEVVDDNVHFTNIHMPLVRTAMIAPTAHYRYFPTISPEEAGGMVVRAIAQRPMRLASGLGTFGEVAYALTPKTANTILNLGFHLFPDSPRAKGEEHPDRLPDLLPEGRALTYLLRAVHW
jgi:NAD(P)-dependent dehydrogenase (short-subunit alcohol dehydrogenase family)